MICWPKKFLFRFTPSFNLQNELLKFVEFFKYLGVMINFQATDDDEISMRMRGIYASGNMLIRKFSKCNIDAKLMMYRSFFGNIYASGLWASYKIASYNKIKISHRLHDKLSPRQNAPPLTTDPTTYCPSDTLRHIALGGNKS